MSENLRGAALRELAQRLGFDLADAFPCHVEFSADLLERPASAVLQAEPETRSIADQSRTIRIPVHMSEVINKTYRISRTLLQEYGREPTEKELADAMNLPVDKIREILKVSADPISLDTTIGEEDDSHLGDFTPGCVGTEFVALVVIKFIYGLDQPKVALLNQIEEGQPAAGVALRELSTAAGSMTFLRK